VKTVCLKEDIDNEITFHETPWDNTQINDDETLTQNSEDCAVKQWDDVGISKEEMENIENKFICQKDPELKTPDPKETETKDSDTSDSEPNDTETNDPETSDSETKDPETKDPETKDPEPKDPEPKETEPKETELKYIEPKSRAKKKKK
jgi:hypothetical protein